ncbi:MAG: hypothetical protein JRN35_09630 [Nitrososphaerota archaeon]|nr:hypothetical protein [Nitrososphaerota archaeon]
MVGNVTVLALEALAYATTSTSLPKTLRNQSADVFARQLQKFSMLVEADEYASELDVETWAHVLQIGVSLGSKAGSDDMAIRKIAESIRDRLVSKAKPSTVGKLVPDAAKPIIPTLVAAVRRAGNVPEAVDSDVEETETPTLSTSVRVFSPVERQVNLRDAGDSATTAIQVDFLVLTATEIESTTCVKVFACESEHRSKRSGRTYDLSQRTIDPNGIESWQVAVVKSLEMGHQAMHILVEEALKEVDPSYILLVGTGGGILNRRDREALERDPDSRIHVAPGTVVFSRDVLYVARGSTDGNSFVPDVPPHQPPSTTLRNLAQRTARNWKKSTPALSLPTGEAPPPPPIEGDFLAGEILERGHGGENGKTRFDEVIALYGGAVSVDMESGAVASVLLEERGLTRCKGYLVVRGVSDMVNVPGLNNDATRNRWRAFAASAAATFAREVILLASAKPMAESQHDRQD